MSIQNTCKKYSQFYAQISLLILPTCMFRFLQLDEPNSTDNQIPFYDSSDHNFTDTIAYHTDIILPMHRKQSKRRRKKQRNRKRHRNRKGNKFYANIEDYLNLTNSKSNQKTRNSKDNCKDCKIRKRKGRNRNSKNRMNTTVLRKILERVADDTLSGARSGEGTISSLLENNIKSTSEYSEHDRKDGSDTEKSWGSSQNWLNLATQTGYSIDGNVIQTGMGFWYLSHMLYIHQ